MYFYFAKYLNSYSLNLYNLRFFGFVTKNIYLNFYNFLIFFYCILKMTVKSRNKTVKSSKKMVISSKITDGDKIKFFFESFFEIKKKW